MQTIKPFLNKEGQIKQLPSKKLKRQEVLKYLGTKFVIDKEYKEREINSIIDRWHTFNDYFLLRRELIVAGILKRTSDGSKYWLVQDEEKL